jgi:hypothetical protein
VNPSTASACRRWLSLSVPTLAALTIPPSLFARADQMGHALLRARGIELVPVDAPTYFTDPSPTAELVRQILGAVSQFEKAGLVAKLRHAREAKRASAGRCEGRKPVPEAAMVEARRLARRSPKTGKRRSLRAIATELAVLGYVGPSGAPYHAGSIRHMLGV